MQRCVLPGSVTLHHDWLRSWLKST